MKNVWYSFDWKKKYKYKPTPIPLFNGRMTDKEMILLIKPYQAGNYYYTYPDYLSGLQYCAIEEEISNFSYNHIKNGLSFGYVINFNNGASVSAEQKDEIERRIKEKLAGSENAGKFVLSFNDDKEHEVTVMPLDVNDAHNQWESLRDDAKYQILTAHGAYPNLFGIKSESGFANNADELNVQSKLLQDYQIVPKQEIFIDMLKPAFELAGLETDLEYLPLRETYSSENDDEVIEDETVNDEEEVEEINTELSKAIKECPTADELINLADEDLEGWECVDERDVDYDIEDDLDAEVEMLNNPKKSYKEKLIQFISTGTARPNAKSEQDKTIDGVQYKVRYEYYPKTFNLNSRPFCKRMVLADKLYRKEDIIAMENKVVNPGWGANGADKYSIWLYKGGGSCHHKWRRKTFKFTGATKPDVKSPKAPQISTNQGEKEGYRVRNPKEVAMRPKDMKNEGFLKPRR